MHLPTLHSPICTDERAAFYEIGRRISDNVQAEVLHNHDKLDIEQIEPLWPRRRATRNLRR